LLLERGLTLYFLDSLMPLTYKSPNMIVV
jgi:hypothetical protein